MVKRERTGDNYWNSGSEIKMSRFYATDQMAAIQGPVDPNWEMNRSNAFLSANNIQAQDGVDQFGTPLRNAQGHPLFDYLDPITRLTVPAGTPGAEPRYGVSSGTSITIDPASNMASPWDRSNFLASPNGQAMAQAAQDEQRAAANKRSGFSKFLTMAAPVMALGGGALLGGALLGGTATGVSAGGATAGVGAAGSGSLGGALASSASSGLGASGSFLGSLSSAFAPKAALSGALKGGIGSFLSGGDLGDALKGAALGGAAGGFGGSIASGIGLSGAGANAFTGALTGASGGLANGDFKSAGIGALLGGGSGYLSAGGNVPGLGNIQQQMPDGVFGPPQQGTGFLGSLSQGTQGTGGMKLSSLLRPAGAAFSAYQQRGAADDIEKMLLEQQNANQALFAPYNESGAAANRRLSELLSSGELGGQFNPEDLENDPGYQFQLQQGEKALGRSQSARGSLYSGAALKEGQQFSQGLSDSTFNDAFRRNLNSQGLTYNMLSGQSGQGLNAAGALSNVNNNVGNIRANATATRSNALNAALSQLLAGDDNIFNSLGFR